MTNEIKSGEGAPEVLLKKLLDRNDVSVENLIQVFGMLKPKEDSPEVVLAKIQAQATKEAAQRPSSIWLKDGVVTAAIAATATLISGFFAGFFEYSTSIQTLKNKLSEVEATQQAEIVKIEKSNDFQIEQTLLNQRLSLVNQILVIDPEHLGNVKDANDFDKRAEKERKSRICLLATFGLIEIPEHIIGVSMKQTKEYAKNFEAFLNDKYDCSNNVVPSSSWNQVEASPSSIPKLDPKSWAYSATKPRDSFDFSVIDGKLTDGKNTVAYYQSPGGSFFSSPAEKKFIVLSYSASLNFESTSRFIFERGFARGTSVHLVIGRFGEVLQMRSFDQTSQFVTRSTWNGIQNLNLYSISIELVNLGQITNGRDFRGMLVPAEEIEQISDGSHWHKYTDVQMKTLESTVKAIVRSHPEIEEIVTKAQITNMPLRDPGPLVDVEKLKQRVFDK